LEAPEESLIAENLLAGDLDFFNLGALEISTNESLMAYSVDTNGSEKYTVKFKNLQTGELLAETITDVSPGIEWANDNKTLFYATTDVNAQGEFQYTVIQPWDAVQAFYLGSGGLADSESAPLAHP
jgi:oligopeptidase B